MNFENLTFEQVEIFALTTYFERTSFLFGTPQKLKSLQVYFGVMIQK